MPSAPTVPAIPQCVRITSPIDVDHSAPLSSTIRQPWGRYLKPGSHPTSRVKEIKANITAGTSRRTIGARVADIIAKSQASHGRARVRPASTPAPLEVFARSLDFEPPRTRGNYECVARAEMLLARS